jgi:hypothetical protein
LEKAMTAKMYVYARRHSPEDTFWKSSQIIYYDFDLLLDAVKENYKATHAVSSDPEYKLFELKELPQRVKVQRPQPASVSIEEEEA